MDFKLSIIKIVVFSLSISSFLSYGNTGVLCENCTNENLAQQIAKLYSADLECSGNSSNPPVFDDSLQCSSENKSVNLINPADGTVYSFHVYHENTPPWDVVATKISINEDARYAFAEITKFHRNMLASISEASLQSSSLNIASVNSVQQAYACPFGTALDVVSDANKLEDLKRLMSLEIGSSYMGQANKSNLNPSANSHGYAAHYRGMTYNVQYQPLGKKPVYIKTFYTSENPTSINDSLAFFVNTVGYNNENMPIILFELSDASRVAGYTLSGLKGDSGPLTIDNPCVEEKLTQLVESGLLTRTSTPVGGGGGGGSFPVTNPPSGGSYQPSCQIVEFYQSGRHLYTFRLCK